MPHRLIDTTAATPPTPGAERARLVARLFVAAGMPLRRKLLRCLLRPLGTLGVAGVASGAFVVFVGHRAGDAAVDAEAVARLSGRQVLELARFVEQVDPQALQQFASVAAGGASGIATTFGAAALALLSLRLQAAARSARPPRRAVSPA